MGLQHPNHFLGCLAASDRSLLTPYLSCERLRTGALLQRADEPITHAYFPRSGILSLVVILSDGAMVEAALAGANTVLGAVAALGGETSLATLTVPVGGAADRIAAGDLKRCADESDTLRLALRQHAHALLAQTLQIGACNAVHTVEQRLCRWLLQCRDLLQSNTLPLTHEFLAAMLGVRRSSVSLAAGELQKAGLVNCRRGMVEVLDPDGLKHTACECYRAITDKMERLTGWSPDFRERTCA